MYMHYVWSYVIPGGSINGMTFKRTRARIANQLEEAATNSCCSQSTLLKLYKK